MTFMANGEPGSFIPDKKTRLMASKQKASENLGRLVGILALEYWRRLFDRLERMPNSQSLFRHITECRNQEDVADHLAIVHYALVFSHLNFEVAIEPCGSAGPDLAVRKEGNTAIVEVMRFREIYPGPLVLKEDGEPELLPYGNLARDTQKAWDKIINKFRQVGDSESIIAIWNDDGDLEDIEVQQTVENLRSAANRNAVALPSNAGFILYGSKWLGEGPNPLGKQFYCFPLNLSLKPEYLEWIREIEKFLLTELSERKGIRMSQPA